MATKKRAFGVVRVSRVAGRDGVNFVSPDEQRRRIAAYCKREGLRLAKVVDELDVSGRRALSKRPGLREAVELVEAGNVDVIVVAYMDRLVRSMKVQLEVVERVEEAGGEVFTLDHGALTNGNAVQKLTSGFLGLVNEYVANVAGERNQEAKELAVARGVAPFANVPFWLRRGEGRRLEVDPKLGPLATEAFELRAGGATVADVRTFLADNGVRMSYVPVARMLTNRMAIGELHFGDMVNPNAFPAIVDKPTFDRVGRMRSPRGRLAKSDRLLARLGIVRCGSCGSRMVAGSSNNGKYSVYQCANVDCSKRQFISATIIEGAVENHVRESLAGMVGKASESDEAAEAAREVEDAQLALDVATRTFLAAGIGSELAAVNRLAELREARDAAAAKLDELAGIESVVIDPASDWNSATLAERRALVRALVESVTVNPGRGSSRLAITDR